jgi:PAS domain S-box-containing protein
MTDLPIGIWKAAIEHLRDPVVIVDAERHPERGRVITYANPAFCAMCGYAAEELIGHSPRMLHGPGTDLDRLKRVSTALDRKQPTRIEVLNYRRNGEAYWVEVSISPLVEADGEARYFVAVERELAGGPSEPAADTPAPRETERAESFNAPVVWDLDLSTGALTWYTDHPALFGYQRRELPTSLDELVALLAQVDQQEFRESLSREALRGRSAWARAARLRTADGTLTVVRFHAKVECGASSEAVRVVGSLRNLAERATARAQILSLAGQLTGVVESISDSLIVTDRHGQVTFANQRAYELLGQDRRILGLHWLNVIPGAAGGAMHDAFVACAETREAQHTYGYSAALDRWIESDFFRTFDGVSIFFRDVTHRVRTEDELRRALKQVEHARTSLQWIYDHTIDVICMLDRDGRILDISASSVEMFGYRPDEIKGRLGFEFVHPPDRERTVEHHLSTVAQENVGALLNRMVHKDGRVVQVLWSARWYPENQVSVAVARDVTESERFQAVLEAERDALTTAQRMARIGTWRYEVASGAMQLSSELVAMLQCPADAAPATLDEFLGYVHPLDHDAFRRALTEMDSEDDRAELVCRVLPARNQMRVISVVSGFTNDRDSGELMCFGTMQDITDHVKLRESLIASEDRFKRVFENSPVPLFLIDNSTSRVIAANRSACSLYGYSEAEFLKLEMRDLAAKSMDLGGDANPSGTTGGHPWDGVRQHVKSDGKEFPVRLFCNAMEYLGAEIRMVLALDLTEQQKLEEQLRQSSKMEAVGQLAGGIAHDFNNLLMAISGFTTLAIEETEASTPVREHLGHVLKASKQAAELTSQLLAFSRKQVLQPRLISVAGILDETGPLLRRLLPESVEITYLTKTSRDTVIRADPVQVQQVLMNLAINARDAMPQGGRLLIETGVIKADSESTPVATGRLQAGAYLMIAVSDTGTGMSKQTMERAFEPFFTTKPKGQGTGLGLATVYGIVKQMGGDARIYSELGRGTTVRVYLPCQQSAAAVEEAPAALPRSGGVSGVSAVVVEDDPMVREFVRKVLASAGYAVTTAANGTEMMEMLRRPDRPDYELLITDMVLPGMSGKRVAGFAQALLPDIAIVFMSGYTEEAIVNQGVLNAGIHFLSKPFSAESLLEKAELSLRAERPRMSASVLIVASDETLQREMRRSLEPADFQVVVATTTDEGLDIAKQAGFDVMLVDVGVETRERPNLQISLFLNELRRVRPTVPLGIVDGAELGREGTQRPDRLVSDFTVSRPLDGAELISCLHRVLAIDRQ